MKAINKLRISVVRQGPDPFRSTERQATRMNNSDEAFAAAPKGAAATIVAHLTDHPSTCDELMVALGLSHSTCSSAVNKLMREGKIIHSGEDRKTRSGRKAAVWSVSSDPKPISDLRPTRAELEARVRVLESIIDELERSR